LIFILLFIVGCTNDRDSTSASSSDTPGITGSKQEKAVEAEPLECDWILEVDDEIEKINYTLLIIAEKKGGTDELGTYTGKALLKTVMKMPTVEDAVFESEVELRGNNCVESLTDKAVFGVVSYEPHDYGWFGLKDGELPSAPIDAPDSMALVNLDMSHRQYYDVDLTFEDGEQANLNKDKTFNAPVTMKITITGGKVQGVIPALKVSDDFEGTVTGSPIAK